MEPYRAIPEKDLDEIERFLLNQMDEAETSAFKNRVAGDAELKKQLSEMETIVLGIREQVLENQLHRFHEAATVAFHKTRSFRTWLAAASVLIVVAAGGWWLLGRSSADQQLFAEYFTPDPGLASEMTFSDNYVFDKGMVAYKRKNYMEALSLWKSLEQATPASSDTLSYFLASAWLCNGNTETAAAYFRKVIQQPESVFRKEAYWYLGLALLRQGNRPEAIRSIEQSDHAEKAALLQKLNSR